MDKSVMQNRFVFAIIRSTFFRLVAGTIKRVEGIGNIPKKGPFIIAANHISFLDPPLLYCLFADNRKYKVHFMASTGIKWMWNIFGGEKVLQRLFGIIPTPERRGGKPKVPSINNALKVLKKGGVIGIFPFPKFEPDDPIVVKTGIARLALWGNAPVIPVAIKGTYQILENRPHFPKAYKKLVRVRIGEPMFFEDYVSKLGKGYDNDKKIFKDVANQITEKILSMCNDLR